MEFIPVVILGALVGKIIDFLKYLSSRHWNAALTMAVVWVGGVLAVFLWSASDFDFIVPGLQQALSDLNWASKVILGMSATSLFSVVYDYKKAFDSTDSATVPQLTNLK